MSLFIYIWSMVRRMSLVNTLVSQRKLKPKLGPPDVYPQVCISRLFSSSVQAIVFLIILHTVEFLSIDLVSSMLRGRSFQGFGSRSALIWVFGSGSGSRRAKRLTKLGKKVKNFMFWSAGLDVLFWEPESKFFFAVFVDPKPWIFLQRYRYWNRI